MSHARGGSIPPFRTIIKRVPTERSEPFLFFLFYLSCQIYYSLQLYVNDVTRSGKMPVGGPYVLQGMNMRLFASNALHLSLRQKIVLILACYVAAIVGIGFISHADLGAAGDKLRFIQLAYGLNNIILEVRRYEKNFLLYDKEEDLRENRRFLILARETAQTLYAESTNLKVAPQLRKLEEHLTNYEDNMGRLARAGRDMPPNEREALVVTLREQGKSLNELSESLVSFERRQIASILDALKAQLTLSVVVAALLGVLLPVIMFRKFFRPLGIIQRATEDIARGHFKEITVLDTKDEMQQVMEAFNRMVQELERRQDQLVESKKLSSIGTLTAGVAHQLNNPLNNIYTSCQIALDEFNSDDRPFIMRMLRNIDQETLRARDIVKGLLEFSRVQEFSLRPAVLAETVERTIRLVQSQVPAEVEIATDIPPELILPLDAQRIQEVFLNLLINAVQAIEGPGRILISAGVDEAANEAVIEIRDTGPGIPGDVQGRIFDPFYTTKEEGRGTGLGLSIVYGIIQKHNGLIFVENIEGGGAKFVIRLPLAVAEQPQGRAL